jgi:chorismate mutase/prephenate dehydratase
MTNDTGAGTPIVNSERVVYLGPPGTFSHAAVNRYFGSQGSQERIGVSSIDDVFLDVEAGKAEYGLVPIENSTEGAVNNTQDCLIDTSLQIVGEVYLPIEHNLLIQKGMTLSSIKTIVSHKQSLAQCRLWLRSNLPDVELAEVSSNAEAARIAAGDKTIAAIAGIMAASNYDLQVLEAGIHDRKNNTTRFLVLSRNRGKASSGHDKTSVLVYTENKPGALFRLLEPFDRHQVSLTRIETRPARDGFWSYVFFIDFEGHVDDISVRNVFAELTDRVIKIKNLGSYPRAYQNPTTS